MNDMSLADRMTKALARIEEAVTRIDAARSAPGLPLGDSRSDETGGDPDLQARYEALQAEAGAALEQIEMVLGTLEGDRSR